jgi:hypothetical protein
MDHFKDVNIVNIIDVVDDLHVLFAHAVMSESTHGDAEELVMNRILTGGVSIL